MLHQLCERGEKDSGDNLKNVKSNPLSAQLTIILVAISITMIWLAIFDFKVVLVKLGAMGAGMVWASRFNLVYVAGVFITFLLVGIFFCRPLIEKLRQVCFALINNKLLKIIWVVFFIVIIICLVYIFYRPFKYLNNAVSIRILFYWCLFWLSWVIFSTLKQYQQLHWFYKIILNAMVVSFVITIANYLSYVNSNPLTLSWSEGSILYYASAFVSKQLYGMHIGLPVINPGRAALQSIAFLVPNSSILFHRLWDAILWIIFPIFVGYSLVVRFKVKNFVKATLLILFSFLFLNLGPVYYHLLIVALIVLIGFRADKFWWSLLVVFLASLWAGLTRINWYPMAGSLAAILFWLETPSQEKLLKDIWKPIVWFIVGFLVSLLAFRIYVFFSGTPPEYFENPLSTPLLWDRLFPSSTNPTGLLQGILIAAVPGIICTGIYYFFSSSYTWIRRICVLGILISFLIGGFFVSVRIGGGADLHNFDGFFLLLMIVVEYGFFKKITSDTNPPQEISQTINIILICLMLILPLYKPLSKSPTIDTVIDQKEYQDFHTRVETDVKSGKSVLLTENPQLLAFGSWETPPAAPEFEKVFLMEAAMTGNQAYLNKYNETLLAQKYDYIVVAPINTTLQDHTHPNSEENNYWVEKISIPMLCYYEVVQSFVSLGMDYLAPRETPCREPNNQH
jgi:hypothetical protein